MKIEHAGRNGTAKSQRHIQRTGSSTGRATDIPDLRTVLETALSERWDKFVRETERARSNPTEKAVHDLRVAMRRLLALLDMAKTALPKCDGAQVRKQLKKYLKSLSDLRDTQVQILEVRRLQEEFKELSPFLGELLVREAAQTKHARKEIQRVDTGHMQEHIGKLHMRLDELLPTPEMNETSGAILIGFLARAYLKAAEVRREIKAPSGGPEDSKQTCENIHRLRLTFKRFRYVVEILKPVFPRVSGRMLKRMRDYQAEMGKIQDTEVLMASISSHAKRVLKKESKLGTQQADRFEPVMTHLADTLKHETAEFLLKVDELDGYWKHIG